MVWKKHNPPSNTRDTHKLKLYKKSEAGIKQSIGFGAKKSGV